MLSLLAIADHPGDTIARYHVANSPLGPIVGFSDYADADTARRLSLEIRRSLLERGYGASIYQWARELTPFCNPRELTRLMQLVSLAYRYEDHATEQAEDFIETVSATKVEDPSAADVRVMNIHQSKGLQFDIVVLPELDGPIRGNVPRMIVGRPSPTEPVEAVFRYAPGSGVAFVAGSVYAHAGSVPSTPRQRKLVFAVCGDDPRRACPASNHCSQFRK